MSDALYRIGTVAELSGLTTHAIRVWERRYGALAPDRTSGNARLYSDADVERLRLLKRAVDHGHAIGQIARLEPAELERLAMPGEGTVKSTSSYVKELIEAGRKLDMVQAEQVLTRASAILPPRALVTDVMAPTLREIGDQWAAGRLCVASEHAASSLVRDRASGMLRAFATSGAVETVLATTPAGELHELGALLAAVIAATQGYRIAYVGPNLPAQEIALAARGAHAGVVLLSIVALDAKAALGEVAALERELGAETTLVIGGSQAAAIASRTSGKVIALGTLQEFADWLRHRAAVQR